MSFSHAPRGCFVQRELTVLDISSPHIIYNAMSFHRGRTQGAPIAGYLLNAFGGAGSGLQAFRPAMYYAGGISLLSLALVLGIRTVMGKPGWAKV